MVLIKSSLLAVLLGTLDVNGYFLQQVGSIGVVQKDPIVDPGKVSNHTHNILGSSAFTDVVTSDILRSGSCTSVPIAQDKSNYWIPQLYFQWKNGSYSSVNGNGVIYYLFDQNANVTAFPDNFRVVSGTQTLRTYNPDDPAQRAVTFMCLDFSGVSHTFNHMPVGTPCTDGMRAQINFPSCWDGKNLDSPDHKSHMAFRSGGPDSGDCDDPSHPIEVPRIFLEMYWGTNDFNDQFSEAMYPKQPFVFSQGDGHGYGYHADFYSGWEKGALQKILDNCDCTIAGFGDPTCCGELGFADYRPNVPECSLEAPSTFPVTGLLPNLPGNNQRTGLLAVNSGEIFFNGTYDLAVPMDQQPPSGIEGVAAVQAPSVTAPATSSVKATSTASTVKAPTASPVSQSSSSVKAPNSTPVSKPPTSASSSNSGAKPSSKPTAVGSSGSGSGSNNNNNNNDWTGSGTSSSSGSASTGKTPTGGTGGSQSLSTNNGSGSSSNQSNQSNSNSGSSDSQAPPAENSPSSSISASSSQETTTSSVPSNNAGTGNGNSDAGDSWSGSSSQNSQAGSPSNNTPAPAQNQPASSGSGNSAPSNSSPSPVASASSAQGTSSANASTSTSPNADKCRNRHASSLEARAQSVPLKHISSHRHSAKSFIRMRNTGDMQT